MSTIIVLLFLILVVQAALAVLGYINHRTLGKIMSEQDDLQSALTAGLAAMDDALAELGALSSQVTTMAQVVTGAAASGNAAAMESAAQQLTAKATALEAAVASAKSALAAVPPTVPAPGPAPAPAPAPEPQVPGVTFDFSPAPASFPAPKLNVGYAQQFTVEGGAAPYQFSVADGTLPPGLSLGGGGLLSGVPTALGDSTFTIGVHDANQSAGAQSYSTTVVDPAAPVADDPGA